MARTVDRATVSALNRFFQTGETPDDADRFDAMTELHRQVLARNRRRPIAELTDAELEELKLNERERRDEKG